MLGNRKVEGILVHYSEGAECFRNTHLKRLPPWTSWALPVSWPEMTRVTSQSGRPPKKEAISSSAKNSKHTRWGDYSSLYRWKFVSTWTAVHWAGTQVIHLGTPMSSAYRTSKFHRVCEEIAFFFTLVELKVPVSMSRHTEISRIVSERRERAFVSASQSPAVSVFHWPGRPN